MYRWRHLVENFFYMATVGLVALRSRQPWRRFYAHLFGAAGAVIFVKGRPVSVMAFIVREGKVVAIDTLADSARIARLDLSALSHPGPGHERPHDR